MAQTGPDVGIDYARNLELEGEGEDVRVVLVRILQVALGFLALIAVLYVMYAGWLWMTSEGDPGKIDSAKKTLVNSIIGLVIMLCAFMIVTWIVNTMSDGMGGTTTSSRPGKPGYSGGIGVLGACIVENVYPEPNQREVPRNTAIIVSFKEEVDPTTICNDINGNGSCDVGEYVIPENVRIFKEIEGDGCEMGVPGSCNSNVTNVNVYTNDNKTFVFVPESYLGSPSEYLWYEVYLSNDVRKLANGDGVFDECRTDYLSWKFEVSDKIDLTPPQVLSGGVYPAPDDLVDTVSGVAAVSAKGTINFSGSPQAGSDASFSGVVPGAGSPSVVDSSIDPNCNQNGDLLLTVLSDGLTAQLSNGGVLLGSAVFSGKNIILPSYFTLEINDFAEAGDYWEFQGVVAKKDSDSIKIGDTNYTYVNTISGANQIEVGANVVLNTITALNANALISASAGTVNDIDIESVVAGTSGNSITFSSNSSAISLSPASGYLIGGSDGETTITINDIKDKTRNSVIQINFNEAMFPITLSGPASNVADYIRVVNNNPSASIGGIACSQNSDCLSFNCDSVSNTCVEDYLEGEFILSNIYRTVEFLSDNLCGVNGCGEEIYCLPENSNIRVEIEAANLDGPNNCPARAPFYNSGVHCQDDAGNYYPLSLMPADGVMDAALNSLDGNRSGFAEGPIDYYNENSPDPNNGDSYLWSFFINDQIDLTPPLIKDTFPAINGTGINPEDAIVIGFDKVMMCSSVRTGTREVKNGDEILIHHNLNAWTVGGAGFGYWTACLGFDEAPLDGEYDWSQTEIRHTDFPEGTSIRSQAGSGLKDINQNCYKPSGDNIGCSASDTSPSCCDGTPTGTLGADGNCP